MIPGLSSSLGAVFGHNRGMAWSSSFFAVVRWSPTESTFLLHVTSLNPGDGMFCHCEHLELKNVTALGRRDCCKDSRDLHFHASSLFPEARMVDRNLA